MLILNILRKIEYIEYRIVYLIKTVNYRISTQFSVSKNDMPRVKFVKQIKIESFNKLNG